MSLVINQYLEPGAYSHIIPNPTSASASGPPIVAIVGQALQGTYTPTIFFNSDDAQAMYGVATKSNPLSLGVQIAFENGAPQVLALNVQPSNSTFAYFDPLSNGVGLPVATTAGTTSTMPTAAFSPATQSLLDPVTGAIIDVDGVTAGVFYIQDFNPKVSDPVYNSSPSSTANQFANSSTNLLQYIKYTTAPLLNGVQQVPLQNSPMVRVVVPSLPNVGAAPTATPALSSSLGTQPTNLQWVQLNNALALVNALNTTPNSPVTAQILVPDFTQPNNPVPNYREMFSCLNQTIQPTSGGAKVLVGSTADMYAYAVNNGFLRITAGQPGIEHEIVMGLFATQSNSVNPVDATMLYPFGLKPSQYAGLSNTNPTIFFNNGTDGVVTNQSYIDAIQNQLTTVALDILVVLNTDSTLQQTIQNHCAFMSSTEERNERIALVSGPISELYTTTIQNVQAIQSGSIPERIAYIWPTGGYRRDPVLRTVVVLDGTFLACACAGILASHDAAEPLTRKKVAGFTDLTVKTTRTQLNAIAKNGVCIIENHPTSGIRVRDGITCDPSTPESQEISVVRQLDFTAQTIRDLLDSQFVATKIKVNTLPAVQTATKNTLKSLVDNGILYSFENVSARLNPVEPRQIDVRFSVRPTYPCKYVKITISVTSAIPPTTPNG